MNLWRTTLMSKKTKRVGFISEEDMRTWTEYLATGHVHDKNHAKQLERLSKRDISLGDVATVVDFMSRRNDGYITALIEQNSVNEKLFNKLGVTDKMRNEAKAEYEVELKQAQEEIKKLQEELAEKLQKGE